MSDDVGSIPNKSQFKIGEVCRITDTQPYVLRFWESEFPTLAPQKTRTGQRLYRRQDIEMVLRIKRLLYEEAYTIAGARKQLESADSGPEVQVKLPARVAEVEAEESGPVAAEEKLARVREELRELLDLLE
jgi:DNA-binding transcriptional MerR regulator